ncbi:MAG: ATP-dependent metallopeptidase FtsH/Yme1/Tma family protein [Myxococcales bacterium]|nr:ATP-dependent metallopeptidase FtsH/Yme1/Tma family protein [Myxococcales bacterium]
MKQSYKTILLWVFLIVVFVAIYQSLKSTAGAKKISFSEFITLALPEDGTPSKVENVTVTGLEVEGELKENKSRFKTVGALDDYHKELISRGVKVEYTLDDQNTFWVSIIGTWLPMIFLFLIFFFFMRQLQSGGGKAMSFGKSKHKILTDSAKKVTFKDIAGIDEAKDELQEIIEFLKDPKRFTRLGGRIPKGVLLMGPPGTGKTLLAKGVAGEAGVPFFSISGSDFVEMFVGVGASRVRDLFEQGKKNAPCIIFIDEIDAVGRHRGAGLGGGHDEREQTLNQLLVEMDGFDSNEGVILMAATNRPDVLDPALLRPGRFDRRVVVQRPDVKGRHGILAVHTRKVPLANDVDLEMIARGTPGFAGADLENLVNEAALLAARKNRDFVSQGDFESAKDKVLMGSERKSIVISDAEKRNTAYHEAGHTLVARLILGADPVHKVTIIPRGRAMGVTQQVPSEDRYSYDEIYVENRIAVLMGGRVAEELVFGHKTTGAGNDIEQATELARKMVCEWGMSSLGTIAYGKGDDNVFLGREMWRSPNYSEATASRLDREVKRIINTAFDRAWTLIVANRDKLDAMAEALLEFETLDAEEIETVIHGRSVGELRAERASNLTRKRPEPKALEASDEEKVSEREVDDRRRSLPGPAEGMAKVDAGELIDRKG